MVGDAAQPFVAPALLAAPTVGLHVYVDNVDARFDKAVRGGAKVLQPVMDMFYGDRVACSRTRSVTSG